MFSTCKTNCILKNLQVYQELNTINATETNQSLRAENETRDSCTALKSRNSVNWNRKKQGMDAENILVLRVFLKQARKKIGALQRC